MLGTAPRSPECISGERVEKDTFVGRQGWDQVPAVVNDRIQEIDSTLFLQPGPAALTDGLVELARIVRNS